MTATTPRPHVLFICTGNIFRSLTAEYALKAHLGPEAVISVHSAGLLDAPHDIVPFVADYFRHNDIDISAHRPRRLSRKLLDSAWLPVAMGTEHRQKIETLHQRRLPLFSEIAYGTEEPLLDVFEVVTDWRANEAESRAYAWSLMDYVFAGMATFSARIDEFAVSSNPAA